MLHLATAVDQPHRQFQDRQLQRQQYNPDRARQQQGTIEYGPDFGKIARPARLRGRAGGAHAQTVEQVVDEIEQHRADGNGADVIRLGQVPHHGGIHRAQQGHGNIGEDDRRSHRPDLAMGDCSAGCCGARHEDRILTGGRCAS